MDGAATRLPSLAARIRPTHVALLGALLVGWSVGRVNPVADHVTEQIAEPSAGPPEEPVEEPVEDRSSLDEHSHAPAPPWLTGSRRVGLMAGLVVLAFFLSSTGISIGPGDASAPLLSQTDLASQARRMVRRSENAKQRAAAARLALLRHLQTAGIAGRGVTLFDRTPARAHRTVQVSSGTAVPAPGAPSTQASPLDTFVSALGPGVLLAGLQASRSSLQQQVLDDGRIDIYPAGRGDVSSGRLDVRILALLEYLADAHGSVTVSCLITGHSLYVKGRPGVVSAHIYGRAVDLSAVGGVPILGNQQPGGITERTVRELIGLPPPLEPVQVISLLSLGGPSFALPDHYNHIHVGY